MDRYEFDVEYASPGTMGRLAGWNAREFEYGRLWKSCLAFVSCSYRKVRCLTSLCSTAYLASSEVAVKSPIAADDTTIDLSSVNVERPRDFGHLYDKL